MIKLKVESLQKVSHSYRLLILSIAQPLQLGIYKEDKLIDTISSTQKTSEVLTTLIMQALEKYPITQMIYTHGPGSYMAIKLTYIMLKTIEIARDIEFVGANAFNFNDNQPIKALGALYFVQEDDEIVTQKFDSKIEQSFILPQTIDNLYTSDNKPLYIIPAV